MRRIALGSTCSAENGQEVPTLSKASARVPELPTKRSPKSLCAMMQINGSGLLIELCTNRNIVPAICPLWVNRDSFAMSALSPLYPRNRTFV